MTILACYGCQLKSHCKIAESVLSLQGETNVADEIT